MLHTFLGTSVSRSANAAKRNGFSAYRSLDCNSHPAVVSCIAQSSTVDAGRIREKNQ